MVTLLAHSLKHLKALPLTTRFSPFLQQKN